MRKAQGLARGRNRRKQQGSDSPAQPQQPQGPGGGGPANQQQQHPQHPNGGGPPDGVGNNGPMQRRKPSPEEQALTAKNYRLAKELVSLVFLAPVVGAGWVWVPTEGNKAGGVLIAGGEAGWTRSIFLAAILRVFRRRERGVTKFSSFVGFDR